MYNSVRGFAERLPLPREELIGRHKNATGTADARRGNFFMRDLVHAGTSACRRHGTNSLRSYTLSLGRELLFLARRDGHTREPASVHSNARDRIYSTGPAQY